MLGPNYPWQTYLFSFIFLFSDLGLEVSVMSHICHKSHNTVTSYGHRRI